MQGKKKRITVPIDVRVPVDVGDEFERLACVWGIDSQVLKNFVGTYIMEDFWQAMREHFSLKDPEDMLGFFITLWVDGASFAMSDRKLQVIDEEEEGSG